MFLFYTFFDRLPKMLFRTYPNRLCVALARPFRLIYLILRPMVAVLESSSRLLLRWRGGTAFTGRLFGNREELRQVMQESEQAFTSEERAMIKRVLTSFFGPKTRAISNNSRGALRSSKSNSSGSKAPAAARHQKVVCEAAKRQRKKLSAWASAARKAASGSRARQRRGQ